MKENPLVYAEYSLDCLSNHPNNAYLLFCRSCKELYMVKTSHSYNLCGHVSFVVLSPKFVVANLTGECLLTHHRHPKVRQR